MFALVDCNNFYVSCERVFRPDLHEKPVLVLSNNDGCVIARSNETKVLGIKMGEPFFKVKALCQQHKVEVFSSNYTLYGDFSERVMSIMLSTWDDVEIYSIDEAFLNLSSMPLNLIDDFCGALRKRILQCTGIPTSIGIGETKTLAKAANFIAKKKINIPVFNITCQKQWLKQIQVGDVGGIGRQWSKKLNAMNIVTAEDFVQSSHKLSHKNLNINLMKTVMELKGQSCLGLEEVGPKKSIVSSCSFGEMQTSLSALKEAVSYHCATAWAKMRKQNAYTQYISVFIYSNYFRKDLPQYSNMASYQLIHPCDDIRTLTRHSIQCLEQIYQNGFQYKKCGVLLTHFSDKQHQQLDLFSEVSQDSEENSSRVMSVLEGINKKYGARTIHLAAEGFHKKWRMKSENKTPCYTTRWSDLPIVYAKD